MPGARLAAVADPRPAAADALADRYGARAFSDPAALIADPDVDAVLIAASSEAHADLIVEAAGAGKAIFCEKPMALDLADADRAVRAADAAGVTLQVGFNRRFDRGFADAHAAVVAGSVGERPADALAHPRPRTGESRAPFRPGRSSCSTLIHDFDTLLWLNPGAEPVEVYATADALVAPDFDAAGLLDTAVVVITFDNGARAVAEASFSAAYGYDVRAEVFGSEGMVTAGDGARSSAQLYTDGRPQRRDRPRRHRADASTPTAPSSSSSSPPSGEGATAGRHRPRRPAGAGRRAGLHRVGPDARARSRSGPQVEAAV